jgi:hypothetical protein
MASTDPVSTTAAEPVSVGAAVSLVAKAIIALLLAFGVHLSDAQVIAVLGVLQAIDVAVALLVRARTVPLAKAVPLPPPVLDAIREQQSPPSTQSDSHST